MWIAAHSRQILLQSPKVMLGGRKHTPHPHHKIAWKAGCSRSRRQGCPMADTPTPPFCALPAVGSIQCVLIREYSETGVSRLPLEK